MKLLSQRTLRAIIDGPAGNIEIMYSKPEDQKISNLAIICHPHPLHEGTMHNKVVTTLAKTFDKANMATIRFNFRGVGKSTGIFDNANGECDDLIAVHSWAQQNIYSKKCILAGFSFGSYICCKSANTIKPSALVTVAPAVVKQDYGSYPTYNCPWWLIQGDKDEITPSESVYSWAKNHPQKPSVIKISDASHFFHGKLGEVEQKLTNVISGS